MQSQSNLYFSRNISVYPKIYHTENLECQKQKASSITLVTVALPASNPAPFEHTEHIMHLHRKHK